jgi:SAM-dependent methyltransferase
MTDVNDAYLRVRQKEGRLYSDEVVARLPAINKTHPLYREWQARADSAQRLVKYLRLNNKHRTTPITIMELGCGNGWLTNYLAQNLESYVWGIDRNQLELAQAARAFGSNSRLAFAHADIFNAPFANNHFDIIVLASVIQYFPDLPALISRLLSLLSTQGELHIIDSPLYQTEAVSSAQARSQSYYASLGASEMASSYYHHTWTQLNSLCNLEVLYDPNTPLLQILRRLGPQYSPFPWVRIQT